MSQQTVLAEIASERQLQDAKWGGPRWDDSHSVNDWIAITARHLGLAGNDGDSDLLDDDQVRRYRKQMLRVSALALAAVESIDRVRGSTRDQIVRHSEPGY